MCAYLGICMCAYLGICMCASFGIYMCAAYARAHKGRDLFKMMVLVQVSPHALLLLLLLLRPLLELCARAGACVLVLSRQECTRTYCVCVCVQPSTNASIP